VQDRQTGWQLEASSAKACLDSMAVSSCMAHDVQLSHGMPRQVLVLVWQHTVPQLLLCVPTVAHRSAASMKFRGGASSSRSYTANLPDDSACTVGQRERMCVLPGVWNCCGSLTDLECRLIRRWACRGTLR
jgi:hypothetical protein